MDIFYKYRLAQFDCLCFFDDRNDKGKWCCGFFCQGEESVLNDGLICYLPLQLKSEFKRNKHLSKLFNTPKEAIEDSYLRWKNNTKTKNHGNEKNKK